jgi:hypothetical protein
MEIAVDLVPLQEAGVAVEAVVQESPVQLTVTLTDQVMVVTDVHTQSAELLHIMPVVVVVDLVVVVHRVAKAVAAQDQQAAQDQPRLDQTQVVVVVVAGTTAVVAEAQAPQV